MNLADSLNAEIEFWADMLKQQDEDTAPEIRDRIYMAKLLAEKKLTLYSTECNEATH